MNKRFALASIFLFLLLNYSFAQQTIPKDTLITLERDQGIFGAAHPCPSYKLTISSNGRVGLEPLSYNKEWKLMPRGKTIKWRISKEQVKQIVSEFEKIDFYSLNSTFDSGKINNKEDCPHYMADFPSATTSITLNGKTKKVDHYRGCSGTEALGKLTSLENKIDEIVNTTQRFECYFRKEYSKLIY